MLCGFRSSQIKRDELFVYEVAHGSQISSAKQKRRKKKEEEEEDVGTCGLTLLMGARRPGAVGSVVKLNPTLMRCSAFTWNPKSWRSH